MSNHAVVWLDQQQARVISVNADGFDEASIHSPAHHIHRHPKGPNEAKEHPEDSKQFFHDLAKALAEYREILLVGPATAKLHFVKYVHKHAHDLELLIRRRVVTQEGQRNFLASMRHHQLLSRAYFGRIWEEILAAGAAPRSVGT